MDKRELGDKTKKRLIATVIAGIIMISLDAALANSSEIRMFDSGGQTYMVRPYEKEGAAHMRMKAKIRSESGMIEKNVDISLSPYDSSGGKREQKEKVFTKEEQVEYELRNIENGFNNEIDQKNILLPDKLKTGEEITWEKQKSSNTVSIIGILLIVMVAIYKNRFKEAQRERKRNEESIIRQLPEFVNRLVLLLNAGLVLNTALEKSIEGSMGFKKNENDYFYKKLRKIYILAHNTNESINKQFRDFAKESGVKELVRISNIINDNIHKGVELTGKLRTESEMLWINRKKDCEERGRLAETKLTLPLVIFLMVLIVITVTPALLEI